MLESAFFAETGLTLTSANHIANLAKEFAKSSERNIANISFINTGLTIIGGPNDPQVISTGWDSIQLNTIDEQLQHIADANSLIAWLREAIKAHEQAVKGAENCTIEEYCRCELIPMPEEPVRKKSITKEEYISSLSIKERNKILMLQAAAAVYGKCIHPDGAFATARNVLMEKLCNATEVKGNGRDTLIYHYKPTVDGMEVEAKFYKLQQEYRSTQAELNGYLHKIDTGVQADADKKAKEFHDAMVEYRTIYARISQEFEERKIAVLEHLRSLRIVIPNELKGIYEIISNLGK